MGLGFYHDLNSYSELEILTDHELHQELPNDWSIIITDVENSTKAVEAGRYRDINTIGAATVSCGQSVMETLNFPYVFGGDGATLVLPNEYIDKIVIELKKLQNTSLLNFDLKLRVGVVPYQDILKDEKKIKISKMRINENQNIAAFSGGGIAYADHLIKNNREYQVQSDSNSPPSLESLSCRWNPIKSKHGKVLSILVYSPEMKDYTQFIQELTKIFNGDLNNGRPFNRNASYKSTIRNIIDELRFHGSFFESAFIKRLKEIFISMIFFTFNNFPKIDFVTNYKNKLEYHTDFKKFDDMLRLVLDCTKEQDHQIHDLLETMYQNKQIYYGTHSSDHSLMTCLVQSMSDGDHIHFMDGGDGGFTIAAKQLKEQLKELN
jgi:hypothetical protein